MSIDRIERVNALLRREIAEAIPSVMAGTDFDAGAVTITDVSASRNLRAARVRVSIFGHGAGRQQMVDQLASRHIAFQRHINRQMRLKYTPVLNFVLDGSLEKGDHVLDLLGRLDIPSGQDGESQEP